MVRTGYLGAFLCVVMAAFVSFLALARYVFNIVIVEGDIVAGGLALYMTLLLAGWVLREERHTRVDFVLDRLKPKAKIIVNIITSFICIFASLLFAWESGKLAWSDHVGKMVIPVGWAIQPPRELFIIALSIGSFLLAWQFAHKFQGYLRELSSIKNSTKN